MSLTNPNKIVTEQRLNEYHNTILPFMGGMPDILANKFARGDMYSTDEKMIGRWIDGKPLYQKVVYGGTAVPNTPVNHNIENVDFIFNKFAIIRDNGDGHTEILPNYNTSSDYIGRINATKTTIFISGTDTWRGYVYWCILNYTKTTDSPIEIGNDTDYSTTEKIVGTWIDGKPIYQRTYVFSSPVVITSNTYSHSNIIISNLDSIISGMLYDNSGQVYSADFGIFVANHEVAILHSTEISVTKITLQYTKTTD